MKRSLRDVATEYATDLLHNPPRTPKMKAQHVVEVLTKQHNSSFPVALNSGTRPQVCGHLKRILHKEYETRCIPGSVTPVAVPELPSIAPESPIRLPTVPDLRKRFPPDATALMQDGAQRLPLLRPAEVAALVYALSKHRTETQRALSVSQGNGSHGVYATLSKPLPEILQCVEDAARQWIIDHAQPLMDVKQAEANAGTSITGIAALHKSKALLLRYGLGGINYAHHDACGDFQALLILSQPEIDYTGGEFYLGDADPPFSIKTYPFKNAGELLIFRGRKGHGQVNYLHGMQEVCAGSAGRTQRFAVGLFQ